MCNNSIDNAGANCALPTAPHSPGCCIGGQNWEPYCTPEQRKECCLTNGSDLQRNIDFSVLGLLDAEQKNPNTSSLFKRVKYVLACFLGGIPGYEVLLKLWQAVTSFRQEAQKDARVGVATITLRIPGRDADATYSMSFEIVDDAPDGQ